jgi:hypothetical protein
MRRPVVYAGACREIVYARAFDGSYPAKHFFDALPAKIKNRFAVSFKKLGDTGKLYNEERFRRIEGTHFFAFECHRYRLFCRFVDQGLVLLTNGCASEGNKLDPEEINRAERIYEEDKIASEAGGRFS